MISKKGVSQIKETALTKSQYLNAQNDFLIDTK